MRLSYGYGSSNRAFATGGIMLKSAAAPVVAESEHHGRQRRVRKSLVWTGLRKGPVFSLSDPFRQRESSQPIESGASGSRNRLLLPDHKRTRKGDVFVNFTLPESNTTWKLQMLANTKDLKYGLLTKEVISSKPDGSTESASFRPPRG